MTGPRTPVCVSIEAQLAPSRLSHCDPAWQVGYRMFFYPVRDADYAKEWDQVETVLPITSHAEARALIAEADRLAGMIGRASA